MAQNFKISVVNPTGGLDKDSDLSRVAPNNYTDALNITHYTNDGQTSYAVQNVLGNEYAFNIPATVQQNKTYRISGYTAAFGGNRRLIFYFTDGSVMADLIFLEGATLADTVANAQTAINAALAVASPPQVASYTAAADNSYFQITITTVIGYDYSISPARVFNEPLMTVQVVNEAWDLSLTGEANIIGSRDSLGDLFIMSTPQVSMPEVLDVTITSKSIEGSLIKVDTSGPHGLESGQSVLITEETVTTPPISGTWIVRYFSPTQFLLENSTYSGVSPRATTATITINVSGIGEIGVLQHNSNTDAYTYKRLLKSKEFNFRRPKQIDLVVERDNVKVSAYWVDDYNIPRVFYYYFTDGEYVVDGGLSTTLDADGIYEYGSINEETKLILAQTNVTLSFTQQLQSGGAVKSGNWRYTVRLLTEGLSATNWLDLSNPVNVFISSTAGTATALSGDNASVETPKINNLTVSGIPTDLFKYIELGAVNYVGDAIVGYNLKREIITSDEMVLSHTGNELSVTTLDLGTLLSVDTGIESARNIRILDNRLVLSNLTVTQVVDFNSWAQNFTYSILSQTINSVLNSRTDYRFGEYADPNSVYHYMGYMHNETYRFGVKVRFKKTGAWSEVFWIEDITFNCDAVSGKRVGTMANYNLTDSASSAVGNVLVKYVQFSNIDLGFLIDGVPVHELIDAFSIERAEVVNRSVLASGVIVLGIANNGAVDPGVLYSGPAMGLTYDSPGTPRVGEYIYIATTDVGGAVVYPQNSAGVGVTEKRRLLSFYSPDIIFGETTITPANADKLFNFGNPWRTDDDYANTGAKAYNSTFVEYNGNTGITSTPTPLTIDEGATLSYGSSFTIAGEIYSKALRTSNPNAGIFANYTSLVLHTTANATNASGNTDYGLYMGQYYRPYTSSEDQYGDIATTKYIPTGQYYELPDVVTDSIIEVNVFGGDVFTQKTFLKYRFPESSVTYVTPEALGYGGAIGFYSQNRVNTQMVKKYGDDVAAMWKYPNVSNFGDYLQLTVNDIGAYIYNSGYTIKNGINSDTAFDENATQQPNLPTRIIYSELKPQNSLVDNFRQFLPLNFRDLSLNDGEIVHHDIFNGELVTWQPLAIQRQFFNTTSQLETSAASIIIGDGSVLSRKGVNYTVIGCSNKWGIIKGRSTQGHDVFYWIDTTLKKAVRMGGDGTLSLSDAHNMSSFFANNLTWVTGKDTPADGEGICGVFSDRSVKWTMQGKRQIAAWSSGTTYSIGQAASYTPNSFSTFEETGEIYLSRTNGNTGNNPESSTANWELVPHTNNEYYNEYTIEFDEFSNTFSTFLSYLPKIYLGWENNFFTPAPISDTGNVYINNKGDYCSWYMENGGGQEVDGSITMVFNTDANLVKRYLAAMFTTEITPKRVDIITKDTATYLVDTNFELLINQYNAAIRNDILTSSDGNTTTEDTSSIWGAYVTVKLTFEKGVFQKLIDSVLKFNPVSRVYYK